uniref:Coiled-coil domain containing 14 n=1 Tax=Pipistrellus kuhlii TaxID=59472 RepID=A0A7J8A5J6_PIPKU|nr:coiled-coil domain containing 14 [Pipistrellus kuhlii]
MRRGIPRAPSRKRKPGRRAKGGLESSAVNSFCRVVLLPSAWSSLKLQEMVRSGSRPGQMLSSGKHTGPAKLTHGKKQIHLRKISRCNADSGYPIHSDSESQTEAVQGLDGCASLLRNILRNEDSVSSDYKKLIPNETSAGHERDSSAIPQNWSFQDHYRMYSPIIYQALCEHVQTQMSQMNNLASKTNPNGIPAVLCHTVSGSESQTTPHSSYSLSTSTPVQLPQPSPFPSMVHSEVQTDDQFVSQYNTTSVNCTDILRNSFSSSLGVQCSLPQTDKPAIPAFEQLDLANEILPQQEVPKESDISVDSANGTPLLKCLQTYMNLLHSQPNHQTNRSPTLLLPTSLPTNEENCVKEQIREATTEEKDSNMHVQDSRIKGVQKAKNGNESDEKIRTIMYLLGELKALVAEQEDSEIQRLITELEACVSLLPATSGNKNSQVEIALAMQPLRSENAQLRRQLRILNQQLREQGKSKKTYGSQECNLELFSLQSLNKSLQNQLQESLKSQELLQSKNEELLKVIENQKDENKRFAGIFKEKDETILENKQQFDIETTRIKIELEEALADVKSCRFKLEAVEKENQILGITLRQRDAEVTRLRDLTRTLQSNMAKLLSDLSMDTARCKSGTNLTKSLLNIYDKQPQHDPVSAQTSIMSYLNKLQTDHTFIPSEPLSAIPNEELIEPGRPYENALPSRSPQHGHTRRREEVSAPGIISTLPKQDSEESEIPSLIEGECHLDNTIYIPLARSSSRRKSPPSTSSPQPPISVAPRQPLSSSGSVSEKESKPCAPGVCPSKREADSAPEKLSRAAEMEDKQLLKKIKEAIGKIPAAPAEPQERAACHVQVKSSAVSDGSFFNSDLTSDWSFSSFSTFTSHDEQDFRNGLAALDANIARLQESLRSGLLEK